MKKIESLQNPLVKHLLQLQSKSKLRKQTQSFLIEGVREISLALKGGFNLESILFASEIISEKAIRELVPNEVELIEISKDIYQKLAYRDTTEGVLAVAKTKSNNLSDLKLSATPLILVAESLEKPGNLGAVLRTADAANIDAVIVVDPKTDLYNQNVVRSSVGCIFTNQIAVASLEEAVTFLKERGVMIYCATLQNAKPYYTKDFTQPTAMVVGTEATGITNEFREKADGNIIIPMQGQIDSMNVSVAASILIFEAKRQRNFS